MFVSEIMTACVAECTEDTKLEKVFELIQTGDPGVVVVVDSPAHRRPIGVVTERSICEQIIARGKNPRGLTAGSVMDSRIKKVRANAAAETLEAGADVAAIVVVDADRHVCGLVSKEKIIQRCSPVYVGDYERGPGIPSIVAATQVNRISEIPVFGWMS